MVAQYGQYTYPHLGNITVNGINTLGENIADNGGIKTSYQAYSEYKPRLTCAIFLPEAILQSRGCLARGAKSRSCPASTSAPSRCSGSAARTCGAPSTGPGTSA